MRQNAAGPEPSDDVSPGMTIVLSLWFGALTGLVEAAYLAVKGIRSGHWMTLGPDAVWQAPLRRANRPAFRLESGEL